MVKNNTGDNESMIDKNVTVHPRILIVDDHPVIRAGLRIYIQNNSDITICGETGNGNEVLSIIAESNPEAVILDLSLEGSDGIILIERIHAKYPKLSILVLSMHDERRYAIRCLRAGARGYLMKDSAPEVVLQGLCATLQGNVVLSESMRMVAIESLLGRPEASPTDNTQDTEKLTARELQVFDLFGTGLKTMEIAEKLGIGTKTVETHVLRIRSKLGLHNLSQVRAAAASQSGFSFQRDLRIA